KQWGPGDEVVLSRLDHDANVRPWVQTGATVRWAEVDPVTGELPVEQYADLIGPRTRLVAVTAASNVLGTRPDVAAICALAHEAGALTYVDGVHRSEEHTSELQSRENLVCRLLLEKKNSMQISILSLKT